MHTQYGGQYSDYRVQGTHTNRVCSGFRRSLHIVTILVKISGENLTSKPTEVVSAQPRA